MSGRPTGVAVATICFDGFDDRDFAETFALAPRLGVRQVEFNAWYPRNLTPAGLNGVVARCRQKDLTPVVLQVSGFSAGPEAGDVTRETSRWLWLLEAAQSLGVTMIKATGSKRGTRGGLEGLAEVLRQVAPVAASRGVTIALENHHDNVIEFPEDFETLLSAAGSRSVGICHDTGHFAASGIDQIGFVRDFADRIVHVDLKDCARAGAAEFTRFGQGVVDFDAILTQVVNIGYRGLLLVELPLVDPDTVLDDLRAGVAIATRHLPDTSSGATSAT